MNFDDAFNAHMLWKAIFLAATKARHPVDAHSAGRDDLCPLGQWLHGDAKAKYAGLRPYAKCLDDHSEFHRQAARVAELINCGRFDDAAAVVEGTSPFVRAAVEIGVALTDLERAVRATALHR